MYGYVYCIVTILKLEHATRLLRPFFVIYFKIQTNLAVLTHLMPGWNIERLWYFKNTEHT